MKSPFTSYIPKVIVFIGATLLFTFSSCKPDEPTPLTKAVITINAAKNVSYTTATLCATLTPNQDSTQVSFQYKSTLETNWKTILLSRKYSGSEAQELSIDVNDLSPNTTYTFKATAVNLAGSVSSYSNQFVSSNYVKAYPLIRAATDVKISSAKLNATLWPNQPTTTLTFEYQSTSGAWQSQTLSESYSGNDSVKVSFDLSGLSANTVYCYRLKASNIGGEVISEVASFETYAVADYDGNLYHSVTIGAQTWLRENFRGTHYANGDPIANVTNADTWSTLTTGAYCWYNNDSENGKVYGGLYNWYVGADARGLVIGWHTPTSDEWPILRRYLGDYLIAGPKVMEAGHDHWGTTSQIATNSSGFTALPNGAFALNVSTSKFIFMNLGEVATFWHSDAFGPGATITIIEAANCGLRDNTIYVQNRGFGLRLMKN